MILINGKAVSNDEVIKRFNLPGDKIRKNAEFWINEELKGFDLATRQKRNMQPQKFPAVFNAEEKNGNTVEVRYALRKSQIKDKTTKQLVEVFSPKKVSTTGDITMVPKLDLAIYFYLNKRHRDSPFRDQGHTIWTYAFFDKEAAAKVQIGKGDVMRRALNHAAEADGKDIKVMAKGLGITAVDEMDLSELRAALTQKALEDPNKYVERVGKQGTKMEGRILDVIDRNLVKLDESYGTPKWLWNAGPNKGQLICEVSNLSITPRQFLVNFVKSNLEKFYTDISNLQQSAESDDKAEAFLSQQHEREVVVVDNTEPDPDEEEEEFEMYKPDEDAEQQEVLSTEEFPESEDIEGDDDEPLPHDFKTAQAYMLKVRGKGGNPQQVKKLWDAVEAGTVTNANAASWIRDNFGE